jgi:RNA polymerase sigma factor (sigma-70 family)
VEQPGPRPTELERRFADGDDSALREAYDAWAPLVLGYCRRRLTRGTDAEDATQQVFVAAWRARDTFDPSRGSLPTWLLGIARYKVVDRLRAQQRTRETTLDRVAEPADADRTDALADRMLVASAIGRLSADQRRVLALSFWEGYSHHEIAARLDLPLGTVKSHARRGLERMRQELRKEDEPDGASSAGPSRTAGPR